MKGSLDIINIREITKKKKDKLSFYYFSRLFELKANSENERNLWVESLVELVQLQEIITCKKKEKEAFSWKNVDMETKDYIEKSRES